MRYWPALLVLIVAGCGDDSMTRQFGVARDAAPTNSSAIMMPLSAPPGLADRPVRAGAVSSTDSGQRSLGVPPSAGQNALLQAAGPAAAGDIRQRIDDSSGKVSYGLGFAEQLMSWSPPPGYTPLGAPASKGWLGRIF